MTAENRKIIGKQWKEGKIRGDFKKYYIEFKDEIDKELDISKETEDKPRGRSKKASQGA